MTNETFHFKNFAFEERDINKLYDPNMGGQLFQFVQKDYDERFANDLNYANKQISFFRFLETAFSKL